MTDAQCEILREAIASKSVEYVDIEASMQHASVELQQALDYQDWSVVYRNAAFIADVAKTLARR